MTQFLTQNFVVAYHARLIDAFGGIHGLRDPALLESALAQPRATFGGEYLHPDIWSMAAAYGFHLCRNHAFLDGNKRIAAVAIGAFLAINGHEVEFDEVDFYLVICDLAEGKLDKPALTTWLRDHARACVPRQ